MSKSVAADLDAVAKLISSRGWAIMRDTLLKEEQVAIRAITSNPSMSKEELDFLRASMRALRLMQDLPEMIKRGLENDLRLAAVTEEGKSK